MSAGAGAADAADEGGDGGLQPPAEHPEWLSLDEGEEVLWVGQPASVSLVPAAVWGVVLLPVFGLGLLVFVGAYLTVTNTDFVVTSTTLYHRSGVLSTNIESVGVDRIQNTEYNQSFFGKQFGYGTIDISTAGSSGSDVTFRNIEDPREVRDLVNSVSRAAGGGGTGGRPDSRGEPTAAPAGVDEELLGELLGELRAVNESMANVERLLREERGGSGPADSPGLLDSSGSAGSPESTGASESTGATEESDSAGFAGSASDFVSESDDDDPPSPFGGDG